MLGRVLSRFRFATTTNKTYGNLKDADRIFTNVYKDSDPYISGALRRVSSLRLRATGTAPRISSPTGPTGSSTKSNFRDSEEEVAPASPRDSSIPSCPKSQLPKGPATWSSTPTSQNRERAGTGKF